MVAIRADWDPEAKDKSGKKESEKYAILTEDGLREWAANGEGQVVELMAGHGFALPLTPHWHCVVNTERTVSVNVTYCKSWKDASVAVENTVRLWGTHPDGAVRFGPGFLDLVADITKVIIQNGLKAAPPAPKKQRVQGGLNKLPLSSLSDSDDFVDACTPILKWAWVLDKVNGGVVRGAGTKESRDRFKSLIMSLREIVGVFG